MPLIQEAIALHYGRSPNAISVGFQDLDGNETAFRRFSDAAREAAFAEFEELGGEVVKLWKA